MAALTRSGARKASEMVILIFRVLQFSRLAMPSTLAVGSAMSSSRQRRPRAIAATNLARVSERIGRACSGWIPSGKRISQTPLCRHLPPSDRKGARWLGKLDDQLVRLDLNARDMSLDEIPVVNGLRWFEMVPNGPEDQRLYFSCRYATHRAGARGGALE
jgi:hypothetical protein